MAASAAPASTAVLAAAGRRRRGPADRSQIHPSPPAPTLTPLLVFVVLMAFAGAAAAAPAEIVDAEPRESEDDSSNEVFPLEFLNKRAQNLGQRLMCQVDIRNCPSLGKKYGRYSWLRSADSTRRRLEFYLANKWQQEALQRQMKRQIPILPNDVNWRPMNN